MPARGVLLSVIAVALVAGIAAIGLWIAAGGSTPFAAKGYRVSVALPDVTGLSRGATVRISGVDVGRVHGRVRGGGRREQAGDGGEVALVIVSGGQRCPHRLRPCLHVRASLRRGNRWPSARPTVLRELLPAVPVSGAAASSAAP